VVEQVQSVAVLPGPLMQPLLGVPVGTALQVL